MPLTQVAGVVAAALCSASAEPGSVLALAQITSQLVWEVAAHKYKAASWDGRFPRAAILCLLTLNLTVLGGDKHLKMHGCRTLSSSCPSAVRSVQGWGVPFPCLNFLGQGLLYTICSLLMWLVLVEALVAQSWLVGDN